MRLLVVERRRLADGITWVLTQIDTRDRIELRKGMGGPRCGESPFQQEGGMNKGFALLCQWLFPVNSSPLREGR